MTTGGAVAVLASAAPTVVIADVAAPALLAPAALAIMPADLVAPTRLAQAGLTISFRDLPAHVCHDGADLRLCEFVWI